MLKLEPAARDALFAETMALCARFDDDVAGLPVEPATVKGLHEAVAAFDFDHPMSPSAAVRAVAEALTRWAVHTPHPRYFGLFNPAPTTMGVAADALVAAFNPQLATRHHAPFAVAAEEHVLRAMGERFGYAASCEGTFTSGGAEANAAALHVALAETFPTFRASGLRALPGTPRLYASSEAHHSIVKAARASGLGSEAVRVVPADATLRMKVPALREAIARDRAAGDLPFLIVATVGTTSAGAIDDLVALADAAERTGCWFHADAAWGGLAALVPRLRACVGGIERADSIGFDAHKALSVPMAAGMFLTRRSGALGRTYAVEASYMPRGAEARDPYARSPQWSRRFAGLKVLLSLAVAGWDGYAEALGLQVELGERLRARLARDGWRLHNATPLPVVCFSGGARPLEHVARDVAASGGWVSVTRIAGVRVLRACVTGLDTRAADVDALADALRAARERVG